MFDGCEKYPVTPLRGSPEIGRWPSRVFTVSGGGARSEVGLQKAWQEMDVCVCVGLLRTCSVGFQRWYRSKDWTDHGRVGLRSSLAGDVSCLELCSSAGPDIIVRARCTGHLVR